MAALQDPGDADGELLTSLRLSDSADPGPTHTFVISVWNAGELIEHSVNLALNLFIHGGITNLQQPFNIGFRKYSVKPMLHVSGRGFPCALCEAGADQAQDSIVPFIAPATGDKGV